MPRLINSRRRWLLALVVFTGLAHAGVTVAHSLLVRATFDLLIEQQSRLTSPLSVWLWLGLGLGATALLGVLLQMLTRGNAERLGQDYTHAVRLRLYEHLLTLAPRTLQQLNQGGLMLRFVGDLNDLHQWVSMGMAQLITGVATACAALVMLTWISPWLALIVALTLTVGAMASLRQGAKVQASVLTVRQCRARIATNVQEKLAALAVVQIAGQTKREQSRMKQQSQEMIKALVARSWVINSVRAITDGAAALAALAALLVGTYEVLNGNSTPGTVVAAMIIIHWLTPSVRELGRMQIYWHRSRIATKKLRSFLRTPSLAEASKLPPLKPGAGRLEFDAIQLQDVITDFSAVAEPGTVTAIIGPNGAGKSTLLALVARLINPDSGVIRLDGQDLVAHSLSSVRRAMGMVGPDLPLLRGSVHRNVVYFKPNAKRSALKHIYQLCGLDQLLAELPNGPATKVLEGGKNLSLGQRQRIALARALLGNPTVLLLDEADANLDAQATNLIHEILAKFKGTVLMVTHDPYRIMRADYIWYVENGRLLEAGPTQTVLSHNGPTLSYLQKHELNYADINNAKPLNRNDDWSFPGGTPAPDDPVGRADSATPHLDLGGPARG